MYFKKNYFILLKNVKVIFIEFYDYKFSKVIFKIFFFRYYSLELCMWWIMMVLFINM